MKNAIQFLLFTGLLLLTCGCRHHEVPQTSTDTVRMEDFRVAVSDIQQDSVLVKCQSEVRKPDVAIRVRKGNALFMETEGLQLAAVDTAVKDAGVYTVTSLLEEDMPPFPQGMMNMTAAAAGYRLLPGGEHFSPYAELRVAYDPERLPIGYTPDDIYTSYYDSSALAWVRLDRVAVDTANHEIVSRTTHFTDFVNELLKAPEMPETQAFVPTAMTDLEAVNPLDGLTVIQPPAANNNGTANISYPIEIPAGRGGMQPSLALTYNSVGGSGWLGVGWDIPVSSITLDTRWGVPRYDSIYETEIYLLDGEQLVTKNADGEPRPMPHRTNRQTLRSDLGDIVQFYTRTGDAHDSIVRHGNSPKNYWWEVVDRNGVTHYYGRYKQPNRSVDINPNYTVLQEALPVDVTYDPINNSLRWPLPTTLCDNSDNIARWVLTESRDLYGNNVRYYYDQATVRNRGAEGRQLYLDSISYTGHNDTDGYYTVVFCRTGNTTNDIPVSCNNGFKEITDQLLNNIYLKCGDSIQTIWHFELENGDSTNYKNRLASVTKIDTVEEIGMRGLLDSLCHCIRQDEDEYATASGDSAYIFIPDSGMFVLDTILVPKYRLLRGKCCITDTHALNPGDGGEIYSYVYDKLYHTIYNTDTVNDSLLRALYDSIYFQASYDSAGWRWYRCRVGGYEIRVDTIRTIVFDSLRTPHHIRPLREFATLGYAGSATIFEYYNAPASTSLFGREKTIDVSNSNKKLHGFFLSDPFNANPATRLRSRSTGLGLSTTSAWNVGGAATVGLGPVVCLTNASLGGNYTRSGSSSETQMALVDLNGDGLSDKVYVRGDKIYFCRQRWEESDSSFYFDTSKVVKGIHHIMRSSSRSNTFGVQAALYVSAGANWTDTKSTTSTYFADVNGDGYVDLVEDGQVYFNHCEKGGVPVFKHYRDVPMSSPESEEAEVIAIVDSMAAACGDIIFDGAADDSINCQRVWVLVDTLWEQQNMSRYYTWLNEQSEGAMYRVYERGDSLKVEVYHREWDCSYHDDSPATDAVRVWIAPRDGEIDITSRIQLQEDISESRRVARHADGVVLSIQKTWHISHGQSRFNPGSENIPLTSIQIDSGDYTKHINIYRRVYVRVGDMIFFRLRSKTDRHFDDVYSRFTIDYTDSINYPNKNDWHFDSQEDFMLSGDYYFQAPANGHYEVNGQWGGGTENIAIALRQNGTLVSQWHVGNDTIYTTDLISAAKGDSIRVELKSGDGSPVNWGQVRCRPFITFVPEEGAERYDSVYHTLDSITLDTTTFSDTDTITGWLMPHVVFTPHYPIYEVPLYRRLFGPLYKGWGQFAYRSEGLEADQIQIEKLVPPDMMVAGNNNLADSSAMYQKTHTNPDTSKFSQSETMEDFLSNNPDFYSPYSNGSKWVGMTPDVEHWVWVGYGHQNTVGCDTTSNSLRTDWYFALPDETVYAQNNSDDSVACITRQIVVHDDPVPPASHGTPAKAVNKVNRSKSHSWSVGFLGAGTSHSGGDNTIEIEYMDLNGDRYPDIIGTDKVQYSQQWGGVGPVRTLDNALSHGSASHTESHGLSFSASQVTQERTTCSLQQNAFFTMHSEGSGGVSGGGNIGDDEAGGSWVDINGDGLPDFVTPTGEVRLNIGYGFLDAERWNIDKVRNGKSGAISVGAGLNLAGEEAVTDLLSGVTNISQSSIEFGAGVDGSYNQTTHMLMDINGDGLPDKLWRELNDIDSIVNGGDYVKTEVSYNLGAGRFGAPETLDIGRFHSSTSFSESLNLGLTYGFTWGSFKMTLGLNGCPYNAGVTQDYVQLADVNADGLPDWVYSVKEDEIIVRYNMGGKTNLLKSATNSNKAGFLIEYTLSEPSYEQPSRSWLMTKVTTHDTLNRHNGATTTVTEYAYSNPHYDRYERTSYGYGTVITSQINPSDNSVYRTIERDYHNDIMLKRGKIKREFTKAGDGTPWVEKLYGITYYKSDTDTVDPCQPIIFSSHEVVRTRYYEGHAQPQLTTEEEFVYDRYHNIVRYHDFGDTSRNDDGVTVEFTYLANRPHNLIGLRSGYIITPNESSAVLRQASYYYNDKGRLTAQTLYSDSDSSVYNFKYEATYGNMSEGILPPNDNNQRMTYHYTYDDVLHTYPSQITNSFGESTRTTYDYKHGKPKTVTDPGNNTMTYCYDFAGRLVSVRSPLCTGTNPSLKNQYHPVNYYHNGFNPSGYIYNASPTGHPYSISTHYDDNGTDTVTQTVVITDGFGRVIQTKKGLREGDVNKRQVSGRTLSDCFGRTVEQYDPVTELLSVHAGRYNTAYDPSSRTATTYDHLDRVTMVRQPLNVTTSTTYRIGPDQSGRRNFIKAVTNANGDSTIVYTDYDGRQRQVTDAFGGITSFIYDTLGQLTKSIDPEGFSTRYSYDKLGHLVRRNHPDAGITEFTYDRAGNITSEITPLGEISYSYHYNRLIEKNYSDFPENDVRYTYGTFGNGKGRITEIEDGTGERTLSYDALGNVIEENRIVALPGMQKFYRFITHYTYDSWGRMRTMTYPDNEVVTYNYTYGGDLFSMCGVKGTDKRRYVKSILYNGFGQRSQITYGNNTYTTYSYDALHRLCGLTSVNTTGTPGTMQQIQYTFDPVGNITQIANNANALAGLGGAYTNNYFYDKLNRLTVSSNNQDLYATAMRHTASGRIIQKSLRALATSPVFDSAFYGYCDYYKPHAPKRIYEKNSSTLSDLLWDASGNLGQINTYDRGDLDGSRFLFWTVDNHLHTAVNETYFSYYAYDHAGERTLKLTGPSNMMDINAQLVGSNGFLLEYTVYPSPYMVLSNRGYTKHYYAGSDRVCARIGGGGISEAEDLPRMDNNATPLFNNCMSFCEERELFNNTEQCIHGFGREENNLHMGPRPLQRLHASAVLFTNHFAGQMNYCVTPREDDEIYYYHSDHLGGANWITDSLGNPVQYLQYLPYGQPLVNQRVSGSTYNERYTFTGKEKDEETGYGYFGARYMDHELMTMWLSVDPMADKYPSISPYNYCMWNPIKVVDPNGMDTLIFSLDHSKKRADYKETRPGGDNVGIIKGGKDNTICEFTFADERWCDRFVACDDEDIVDMNLGRDRDHYLYNSIVFIDDKKIESILKEGGLNFADLRSQSLKNKIGYAKEQSRGTDATLDFVNYKGVQEISPYKLILTGSQGNYLAHDKFNFGNFLWGMAMRRMGMPRWLVLAGSHWDCYRTTKRLDSFDDQRSLWFGYNKAIK